MKTITYYDEPFLNELESNVIKSNFKDNLFYVVLDKTLFYVEGGGMNNDKGTINDIEVIKVFIENDEIVHVLNKNVEGKVIIKIDKEDRLKRMQCHTSQHLISALFINKYDLKCLSNSYISDGTCDILLSGKEIDQLMLQEIEKEANELITKDIKVDINYLTKDEAQKYCENFEEYALLDKFRLVTIEGIDKSLCGCLHVPSLKYLKGINLIECKKIKDNYQIIIDCGDHLISKAHEYFDEVSKASNLLNSKKEDMVSSLNNFILNFKKQNNRLTFYKHKYLELYSSDKLNSLDLNKINVIYEIHEDLEKKDIDFLVSKYSSNKNIVVVALLINEDKSIHLMIAKNKFVQIFSAKNVFLALKEKFDLRGGGSDFIAQGGGKYNPELEKSIKNEIEKELSKII